MRSILVLLVVLFFGVLAQAQDTNAIKVEVVKTVKVFNVNIRSNTFTFDSTAPKKKLSLVYKRRFSAVKKHLFFKTKENKVKVA